MIIALESCFMSIAKPVPPSHTLYSPRLMQILNVIERLVIAYSTCSSINVFHLMNHLIFKKFYSWVLVIHAMSDDWGLEDTYTTLIYENL